MPSQRESNTMSEGLQKVLSEITKMKVMPDADLAFLVELETGILTYLRAPTPTTQAGAPLPPVTPDMPPPQMGGQMGPGPNTPPMPTPTGGAGGAGGGPINPDELRRVLTQSPG